MNKKSIIFIILILLLIAGGVFWQWQGKETTKKGEEKPLPVEKTSTKITGSYIEAPEAKGKIELIHRVVSEGIPPKIEITVKNISNEKINFDYTGTYYYHFSIEVISKNKEGRVLGEPSQIEGLGIGSSIAPREVKILRVSLFSSDETKGYEIRLKYKNLPKVTGTYIQSPEAAGKIIIVNHYLEVATYNPRHLFLILEVKNISTESIGIPPGYLTYTSVKKHWYIRVTYKDASGTVIETQEQEIGLNVIKTGESEKRRFTKYFPDTIAGFPKGTESYETTVIVKTLE